MVKKTGSRDLTVRVKTARGRTNSSTRWLQRQLNDPYVQQAKRDGYRSRAAYKLVELDDKFTFFKPGQSVVDLGAAPGGWSQVALERMNNKGTVIGIDLLPIDPIVGTHFEVMDFNDEDAPERLFAMLERAKNPESRIQNPENSEEADSHEPAEQSTQLTALEQSSNLSGKKHKADIVMSDMAANTTGHPPTDHIRIISLCELAYDFATQILNPGGAFICKVLRGGTEGDLLKMMKQDFTMVKHAKPQASRKDSAESYVVATGFRKT